MVLRRALLTQAMALMLCVPLVGGRGLTILVDAIIFPHGACCCERAHGAEHRCHCAEPHEATAAEEVHARGTCLDQWEDGGEEFGPPSLWNMPVATLIAHPVLSFVVRPWTDVLRHPLLKDRLAIPPPTPPPDVPLV